MILTPTSVSALEQRLRVKLADWRGLLTRNVETGRDVLRTLFTPVIDERRRGYAFRGAVALDRLIAGMVDLPTQMASPSGSDTQGNPVPPDIPRGLIARQSAVRMS